MLETIVTKADATPQDETTALAAGATHEDVRMQADDSSSILQMGPGTVLTTLAETATMHGVSPIFTRSVLIETLRGYKRYVGFVSAHTAHVMGFATDAEFAKMAEPFCIVPGNAPDDLALRIAVLQRETGIDFEPEELSELFSVTIDEIDGALSAPPHADAS